jgi:phosphatidylserine/phosphatidylglycerophosphate/cardiolipin synthase-like enzyme
VTVTFLRDVRHGGARTQPQQVADLLAAFIASARRTIDVAIYDFRLEGAVADTVVGAIRAAAGRDVGVRIAYDASKPAAQITTAFAATGGDPAPVGTEAWLRQHFAGTSVALQPIATTSGNIMHDKYVVRDAGHRGTAVWTGSANFTTDAWTHQENNVLGITSARVASAYSRDFEELWAAKAIKGTGADDLGSSSVAGHTVEWAFGPGQGAAIDAHLATLIAAAKADVAVASMVLTSATVLGALVDAVDRGVRLHGIYDGGQMGPIVTEWKKSPAGKAKAATFAVVAAHLASKRSAPYTPRGIHDFMHNKTLVIDEHLVATGSHNFSHNATGNAENLITLHDPAIAASYATYVAKLEAAYH